MKVARQIGGLLAATLAAFVCAFPIALPAYAESAAIGFSGVVPEIFTQGSVVTYPGTLVSFTDHAVLPVVGDTIDPARAIVFDESGNLTTAAGAVYTDARSSRSGAVLVRLGNSQTQEFKVCKRDGSACVRYRVERY